MALVHVRPRLSLVVRRLTIGAAVLALAAGCGSGAEESPTTVENTKSSTGSKPQAKADPPERFAAKGVPVGQPDVVVGHTAAFEYQLSDDGKPSVVGTALDSGDEMWRWDGDALAQKRTTTDERATYLALSRVDGKELLQFTGVSDDTTMRTTVLDAATGDVVVAGSKEIPAEVDVAGGTSIDVASLGVRDGFAVATLVSTATPAMTMITDLESGGTEWGPAAFLAGGIVDTGAGAAAVGITADSDFSDGTMRAVALDTRETVWTGGTVRAGTVHAPVPTLVTADLGDVMTNATHLFDPATGKEIGALDAPADDCLPDDRDVVVCVDVDNSTTLDAKTGKQLWQRHSPDVTAAFHGRVYAEGTILDARSGKEVSTDLAIRVDAAVPGYAITRDTSEAVAYPAK